VRSRRWLQVLLLTITLCGSRPVRSSPAAPVAAWVVFETEAELLQLARHLDIWEVHREGAAGRLLAGIGSTELTWLASQRFSYTPLDATASAPAAIETTNCYRTVDALYEQLTAWAAAYPDLTELRTIGESYEGRQLLTLRLTNQATGGDKPVFFLMAGIHGRELITPEAAMVFIDRILSGYGFEADVTWLLDYGIIEVMVVANPDGHVRNESNPQWPGWRKNTNRTHGTCDETSFGVDLNRNFAFAWGNASTYPCSETYQGPAPISETETQAITDLIRDLYPDQRPDDLVSPAPDTTSGLFITLHSYGDLVLWPWGNSYATAPNAAALSQLGEKFADYNDYIPQQASDLYPASGTTDDFVYGELGIAAYTFEIGSYTDGFFPPCYRYAALIEPNIEAFLYAAKVAHAPYRWPAGPDVVRLTLSLRDDGEGDDETAPPTLQIITELDDSRSGGEAIVAAEATIGIPPWLEDLDGYRARLHAADGAFDAAQETVSATLSLEGLPSGRHLVFVRGQDAAGNWGAITSDFITLGHRYFLPLVARD
jgi:carboxypeptidase T